jgi:hypothetical protein
MITKNKLVGLSALMVTTFLDYHALRKRIKAPASPPGYDINKPKKYGMPDILAGNFRICF